MTEDLPKQGTIKEINQVSYSDGECKYITEYSKVEKSDGSVDYYQDRWVERENKD